MERNDIASLTRIASFLKIPSGKIDINNEKVVCRSVKNENVSGFTTIVSAMGRESINNTFASSDLITQCLIAQWFDYAVLFVGPAVNSKTLTDGVLQELDDYLLNRSYLVGQNLSLADVAIFYSLYNIMIKVSSTTKGKFVNVTRWYDHLQKNNAIRQNLPIVNLSNSLLYG